MTHLTDKEIAKRFMKGESVYRISQFLFMEPTFPYITYSQALEAVEAALRRVILKQEKKK